MAEQKFLNLNGLQYYTRKLDEKKANIESPDFTGTPTAPTPDATTNNTQIATTAFVQTAINDYVKNGMNEGSVIIQNEFEDEESVTGLIMTNGDNNSAYLAVVAENDDGDMAVRLNVTKNNNDSTLKLTSGSLLYNDKEILTGQYYKEDQDVFGISKKNANIHIGNSETGPNVETYITETYGGMVAISDSSKNINETDYASIKVDADGTIALAASDKATYNGKEIATIESPALTGTPTAPTPPTLNNSTRIATTEFVYNVMETNSSGLIAGDGIKIEDGVISVIEDDDGFGPDDFQKAMLQYFDAVGDKDSTMKPYCQKMRYSILNMEEFGKLGSGLFIHWGIYSVPAGVYTGTKQPGATVTATTTNYNAEWAMRDLGIPKDVYKAYENQFTGENFDAEAICELASNLGMKYIIITTKHHEGFCLAPTEHNTGWDIRTAACRNTIIDELAEACKKYKLKLCFYYSQYWDWMAEGGFGLNKNRNGQWSTTDLYTTAQHTEYCNKAIAQINELVEKYHPYVLWYDPGENVGTTYRDMFRAAEKEKYINVITNDRLGYNREYGDFGTGERTIYLRTLPYGESCFTLNNTWGYSTNNETENIYYSLETLLKQFMLYTISYGQNCVLNVGPKPDGSLPTLTQTRLTQLQSFITNYANGGFYNYKRVNTKIRPKWGYMIEQPNNKIMCYVIMPGNKNYQNIILDGVDTTLLKTDGVHILTPGTNASYTILDSDRIQINNLALDSNSKIGIVELEYTNEPLKPDYVTAMNHELITSRVFPVNATTYDFSKCIHYGNQSNNFNLETRVKWIDETKECGIVLDYTYNTENRSVTTNITVTDVEDSTKTQTFTYGENDLAIATRFNFEQGHVYNIKFQASGSIAEKYYFNGFTIEKNDVEHVTGVTISPTSLELPQGGTAQLTHTITPAYADDTSVTWESDNTDVATVSSAGFVTAGTEKGTANITVTSTDGSYAATCVVTVKDIAVTGVELESDTVNMYQAETRELHYTLTPENAGNQLVSWSSNNANVHVDNGIVSIEPDATGTAIITITTDDGSYTDTCEITIVPETYDYIFQADSLPGTDTQGEDTGITLFDDEHTNWTILSYAQNSVNAGQSDNNATLYQIVVNASPWIGMRVDADNNNYPRTSATYSPLIPRFVGNSSGCDIYINPITGIGQTGKPNVNPTGMMHPICFSRDGDTYKYSHDGVCWTEITGIGATQIARLKTAPLTVTFDYRRSSGTLTTTKYRKLITNDPCCVAIKYESEYPFWKLYNQYDEGRTLGEIVE